VVLWINAREKLHCGFATVARLLGNSAYSINASLSTALPFYKFGGPDTERPTEQSLIMT
jgi:hypothetical protein